MDLDGAVETLHGTAIALVMDGVPRAALIRGTSGSGKSDLALRCLALVPSPLIPGPAHLVADDQVIVTRRDDQLVVSPPASIAGLMEVRGLGIVALDWLATGRLAMFVDLVAREEVQRLPDPVPREAVLGVSLPVLRLHAFDASAAIKLMLSLKMC